VRGQYQYGAYLALSPWEFASSNMPISLYSFISKSPYSLDYLNNWDSIGCARALVKKRKL
jgi:hypothetical protein